MSELKTLKDIPQIQFTGSNAELLKQEAIKWIKELRMRESYQEHSDRSGLTDLIHSIDWIKCFFNITDEDL